MAEATRHKRRFGRRSAIAAGACVFVVLAGTALVMAGGVDAVVQWFATAEMIEPDGTRTKLEVPPEGEILLDETHRIQVPADRLGELQGRTMKFWKAPNDSEASGSSVDHDTGNVKAAADPPVRDAEYKRKTLD